MADKTALVKMCHSSHVVLFIGASSIYVILFLWIYFKSGERHHQLNY